MTDLERFIEITNKYYNGEPTEMSDKEYDLLEKKILSENPGFRKFDHLNVIQGVRVTHYEKFQPQDYKIAFESIEELKDQLNNIKEKYYLTYKYDGSSIRAYYKDGKLYDIITRSDEWTGIRQLSKLINKVPNVVDNSVITIDFEALTSKEDFGEDSRSKSNGLINSKYMQDQVDQYLKLVPFKVTSTKTTDYLESMKLVFNDDEFIICNMDDISYESRFIEFKGLNYPIDGFVVYYSNKLNHGIHKFYSGEDEVTEVTNIIWSLQDNGSYTPKLQFNPIKISGRTIRQATSNGYARLSSIKAGIGSKITVILANSTIPQVHKVISPSEDYNIPKTCNHCGGEMGIVNNKVRCLNEECNYFYNWISYYYLQKITDQSLWEENKKINFYEDLRTRINYLKENNLIDLNKNKIGNCLMNSVVLERFSETRKNNLINFLNENCSEIINSSLKDFNLSRFMSWNQWLVFEGYLTIMDKILHLLYKE